ncbi:helix-turn-helix domain-containing protein [Sulfurospirillum cavolei]|uniref:helix-turn-helix domain-containing protein n=1 Tax=Sulfurospirillum cavolei TaxID=366522 RepID=UPI0005A855EB|nr:helix-turn-helix domain-containing protein [Sulfurospirillum cavolei]
MKNTPTILNTHKKLGKIIQAKRKELGLDIADMYDYSEVSPSIISGIENGKRNPTIATLEKILNVLGLELCIKSQETRI